MQEELSVSGGGPTGAGLRCVLDGRDGRVVELVDESAGDAFVARTGRRGGLEVFDELERKWYTDLHTPCSIGELRRTEGQVSFVKRFEGAPFSLRCRWRGEQGGLSLEVDAALDEGAAMRSIRISFVLPVTPSLVSWAPSYPETSDVLAHPVHYCYLAGEKGKARTGIPMLTLYHPGRGGLSLVMPFELPKVQLNMGVEPADPTAWYVVEHVPRINAGAEVDTISPPEPRDLGAEPVVRFTEKHVGLRPGKVLRFGLWLFAHLPDWRVALGRVVERYRDYFEPHPQAARFGPGTGLNPANIDEAAVCLNRDFGVTHVWFHGHFEFHGEFLTDQALSEATYRWECEPYADWLNNLSVEQIRRQIDQLQAAGIATFLYGFNMHCDPTIIEKRKLHADEARNEDGQIARAYHDQPVMFFSPESPFGRQLLDQADRMTRTYPQIAGLALDNWNYTGIDFGHDDGITMVNNRPAANVNFSQQRMIGPLAEKMHSSGRFLCTNKGRTIESMRGVDCVLTESSGAEAYATFAYMNLCRNVYPAEHGAADDPGYAEGILKYLLIWGGQMGRDERQADLQQARAYQPLLALLQNRRWVFEPDPLTLPEGTSGQIFRIDERSPVNPGAVVVTVVREGQSWRDRSFRQRLQGGERNATSLGDLEGAPARAGQGGPSVCIRLADGVKFTRAEWLAVERSGQPPVACEIHRAGGQITVALPFLGCAGVLKLT